MFNTCRRGPASISRVFRAASTTIRVPSTRPSTLSLSFQSTLKPLEARWVHESSQLKSGYRDHRPSEPADAPRGQREDNSPKITKFAELAEQNLVHPNVVDAIIKGMGHETMTEVQTMTINQALQGTDVYVLYFIYSCTIY